MRRIATGKYCHRARPTGWACHNIRVSIPAEFVLPGPRSITQVLGGAASAVGIDGDASWAAAAASLGLPQVDRVCVVLIDGLGLTQLRERSGHFPFLRRREHGELTTVVPSTTAAAVTAVGTGARPGETGMLGYTVREPESGELLNLIKWDAAEARRWQTVPTVAERARRGRFTAIGPSRFVGSGLNTAALRGFRDVSAESLAQRVDATTEILRARKSDVVYLYWGELDHMGHRYGWNSWEWGDEALATDSELQRLFRELPKGTLVILTADHGMVDVDERIDIAVTPQLSRGVIAVAGEPRASHIFTDEPEALSERWRDYLGERAWVIPRAEAIDVIGDVHSRFAPVIGDVVVFARGKTVVVDSASQTPGSIALVGVHGSLTAHEMLVPCIREVV